MVLIPITRPELSRSGPPELPGLIAASVWIRPPGARRLSEKLFGRFSALTMPRVTENCSDPNGLPKTIRAFDASPWFERPAPSSEDRGEKSVPEGRRLTLTVLYRDVEGRMAPAAGSAEGAAR